LRPPSISVRASREKAKKKKKITRQSGLKLLTLNQYR
jgi:hypothetical protein